jgi:pimeloyl-ACP methyl ester carboxylesterase
MDGYAADEPRVREIGLPSRGGAMAALDLGPPNRPVDVVFSHANGFNARTYRTILAPLAGGLRILAVDIRGHGASTLPTDGRSGWNVFRDDLLALLAAEAADPVVLAGHSMGGTISLLAAALAPGRVTGLALFDPVLIEGAGDPNAPNPLAEGADRRRARFASKAGALASYTGRGAFRSWRPEQLVDYVEAGFREDADGGVALTCAPAWEASNFRNHAYDPWAAFRQVRCPVRMLRAERHSTARVAEHQDELLATGRVTIETVPDTTHFLPMERPELVRAAIAELARKAG